ncbi:DoxX family membrane protein [Puia sp. P3]|uniref:DoxX family membrane protein n=1 Tax=Puia sp. P3 TaxID=3423952 RepID=UPI003D6640CC
MRGKGSLWARLGVPAQSDERARANAVLCLRIAVFLLLLGHGWLNLIEKKALLQQYSGLGFPEPAKTAFFVGLFEILAAVAVLVRPVWPLLFVLLFWKMGTELFYPHYELFEWIERGGSYGCLLALFFGIGSGVNIKLPRLNRTSIKTN